MHFLFTAPRYHTNQHFAVKALLDAGHDVTFLSLTRGQSEVYDALHPVVLGSRSLPSPPALWRLMRRSNPDAVVVRNPNSAYGLLAATTARLMGKRIIFYSQTPVHRTLGWRRKLARSIPARLAGARWISPVLGNPDRFTPGFSALRYVPFVMEPQTSPELKQWFRGDAINVLCIGKFEKRKNHRMVLQAVARLSGRHTIQVTLIGECTSAEHERELAFVRESCRSLGLEERARIETNLTYRDVQREYPNHDLFVLPSSSEPAAVSHLEAMSHSLPVICSDSNGTECYIRPGENGYVFRADDLRHLEEVMEKVIRDRARLKELGARSYQLVRSEHTPEQYVKSLVSIAKGEV